MNSPHEQLMVADRSSASTDSALRYNDWVRRRTDLVETVLHTRAMCERITATSDPALTSAHDAQLLLCAAVGDLSDLDDQLDRIRIALTALDYGAKESDL